MSQTDPFDPALKALLDADRAPPLPAGFADGVVAAAETLNQAAEYCEMIAAAPEDCLLVTGFADRLAEALAVTEALNADERRARAGIVSRQVTLR